MLEEGITPEWVLQCWVKFERQFELPDLLHKQSVENTRSVIKSEY